VSWTVPEEDRSVLPSERADAVAFCERLRPKLVGALSLYCGDPALAEEQAQDTLVRVWENWHRVRAMQAPEAWAVRVGMNGLHAVFRRRAIERRALARVAALPSGTAATPAAEYEHVRRAVATLPRRQRTALVLRFYLDLSVSDTAGVMGCAEGTVKSLTNRAIGRLGPLLAADDEREVRR
jgi:RNA polymerase sigma factor (sigma-70 family)